MQIRTDEQSDAQAMQQQFADENRLDPYTRAGEPSGKSDKLAAIKQTEVQRMRAQLADENAAALDALKRQERIEDVMSPERIELDEAYSYGTMTTSEYDDAVDELKQYQQIAREVGVTVRQVEDVATHLAKIANEAGRAAAIDRRFAKYDDPHGFDTFVEAHVTRMSPENLETVAQHGPSELDRRLSDYSPE